MKPLRNITRADLVIRLLVVAVSVLAWACYR